MVGYRCTSCQIPWQSGMCYFRDDFGLAFFAYSGPFGSRELLCHVGTPSWALTSSRLFLYSAEKEATGKKKNQNERRVEQMKKMIDDVPMVAPAPPVPFGVSVAARAGPISFRSPLFCPSFIHLLLFHGLRWKARKDARERTQKYNNQPDLTVRHPKPRPCFQE